jgi:glycosyltransferase involved in cell wall biosynthesis
MNITMLTESLGSGGAERQLCTLAVEMKRRGHTVQVVTYAMGDFYLPMLQKADVNHIFLGGKATWDWQRNIRRFLRSERQDVVLAFLQSSAAYAELAAFPARRWGLVVSERDSLQDIGNRAYRFRKYFHLIADAITVNSHSSRLKLEKAVPALKNRMVTIYNAVDLDMFQPSIGLKKINKAIRLIVAGRIDQNKNLMGTIDAIGLLRHRHGMQVFVDWFGSEANEFSLVNQFERRIKEQGLSDHIHMHPPTPDIIAKYQQSDAVLLPSFYEGLPNTVCEGMSCGKPVLMSAVCDAGNLVKEGQNGFLFSPHDPNDIANAIERFDSLTEAQRHAMGEASRQMAEEYFSLTKIADLYETVLLSACQRQHPNIGHWLPEVPWTALPHNKLSASTSKG